MRFDKVKYEASYGTAQQLPKSDHIEIAFAGRSNVGKSSMLNKILNRKNLARVSSVPGKTVTVNFFDCDGIKLVDLPGYGYAKVNFNEKKRWADLMEGYFTSERNIRLVVQLTDMRHPVTKDDLDMMRFMQSAGYDFIVVMTKSDKLNKTERNKRLEDIHTELAEFGDVKIIPFSASNGEGAEEIRKAIEDAVK
ncbi:MAG TPA: YihA family ribosome biogenesis GTP-binding protein [Ruminococcaceae bacterium]|nr:YihA family ribosome biogenesis GTP-binding protein [Oscillospiraceae bacterium]HCT16029.1 YihA family ribosome biogenesis GTP-binding protein [Oscillospiraceae bacterium]